MNIVKFQSEPLTCPSCIKKIEGKVGKMEGVEEVKVLFNSSKVKTSFDADKITAEEIRKVIEKLGYPIALEKTEESEEENKMASQQQQNCDCFIGIDRMINEGAGIGELHFIGAAMRKSEEDLPPLQHLPLIASPISGKGGIH